ncbi:MAG: hypothetical protein JWQ64_657 [Subtercola sp.]|nr:hypothetical protein [Subtercola sp.]
MGFFDRLFGREQAGPPTPPASAPTARSAAKPSPASPDEIAVERYRYLLRTAPPETVEEVHREAFAKLTPQQRDLIFSELTANAPAGDAPADASPNALARSATRSEIRQPGVLEKSFSGGGGAGGGIGFGGVFASSLLGSVAGYVIGSSIAQAFIPDSVGADAAAGDQPADTAGDTSGDGSGGDGSGGASAGGDTVLADGGDTSGAGSDFGGDFGGGDAGGDFGGGGDFGF